VFGSLFRKKPRWQDVDFMDLVPAKVRDAETDPQTGQVRLLIPRYEAWPFNKLIQPRLGPDKKFIRVPLEERGSHLWRHLDGVRCIGDLVPVFEAKFPEDTADIPQRVSAYLYQMYENRMIDFVNLPR
jgi:hypothetical protein